MKEDTTRLADEWRIVECRLVVDKCAIVNIESMFCRSFFRSIFIAVAVCLGVFVSAVPQMVLAGNCACTCSAPGGGEIPVTNQSCTTRTDCGFSTCQAACTAAGTGYTVVYPADGTRNFACIGANEPAPPTAPTGAGQGAGAGGQQGGAGGGVPPAGGTGAGSTNPSGTGTGTGQTTDAGTPTQAPPPPAGTLRLVLPSCTQDGNCSLTDIINTGIRIANLLLAFSGFVFLATVLWAGAQILVFAYEADSYKKAQKLIEGAILGLVIVMVAGVLVRLVSDTLGVDPRVLEAPGGTSSNAPRPSLFRNLGPGSGNGGLPSSNPTTQNQPPSGN